MPPAISRCIVFDDDPHQLANRIRQAVEVLDYLHGHGKIEYAEGFQSDDVIDLGQRAEVLEHVVDHPETLLIADLRAEAPGPAAGNVGARLVRAIAQNPLTSMSTRRIVWSRHNVSQVTDDLRRWVHAFALYDAQGDRDLADAIVHALDDGEESLEAREFPAARTPGRWSDQVRNAVARLVRQPRAGDDLIALRLAAGVDRVQINFELARSDLPNTRPNVSAFITQIVEDSKEWDPEDRVDRVTALNPEDALAQVKAVMDPFAVDRVPDPIRPKDCDQALHYRRGLRETHPSSRHLQVTWLTNEEDQLAEEFLSLYTQRITAHGNNQQKPNDAIQRILGVEDFIPPDPAWLDAMQRTGLDADDLAYAIWTYIDVRH